MVIRTIWIWLVSENHGKSLRYSSILFQGAYESFVMAHMQQKALLIRPSFVCRYAFLNALLDMDDSSTYLRYVRIKSILLSIFSR